jgi:hypothetical protein
MLVGRGTHISKITAKANRTLGLIKRTCKDIEDKGIRKLLYLTLVRPQPEFSSELWSPSEVKYQLMLEGVQHRGTKFILKLAGHERTCRAYLLFMTSLGKKPQSELAGYLRSCNSSLPSLQLELQFKYGICKSNFNI